MAVKGKKKPKKNSVKLCVNIDHVATVRQARQGFYPDPVIAAYIAEQAGAAGITVHLREDRRHINDMDVKRLRLAVKTKLNLEMSLNSDIIEQALLIVPDEATIVPEKRKELTTEGGLDVIQNMKKLKPAVKRLKAKGIIVSLFIDPVKKQIEASAGAGADFIEIHTGAYANARSKRKKEIELKRIKQAVKYASGIGLGVNAGHGLDYENTRRIAKIRGIAELNTGHSIIAEAVAAGLKPAVKKMLGLIS